MHNVGFMLVFNELWINILALISLIMQLINLINWSYREDQIASYILVIFSGWKERPLYPDRYFITPFITSRVCQNHTLPCGFDHHFEPNDPIYPSFDSSRAS